MVPGKAAANNVAWCGKCYNLHAVSDVSDVNVWDKIATIFPGDEYFPPLDTYNHPAPFFPS